MPDNENVVKDKTVPTQSKPSSTEDAASFQLPPEVQRAVATIHAVSLRAAASTSPILEVVARAAAAMAPLNGVLRQIQSAMQPLMEPEWQRQLLRPLHNIQSAHDVFNAALQNAEALGSMGWTIPMNAYMRDCVALLQEVPKGPEATDAAFARFYADNDQESLTLLLADLRQHAKVADYSSLLEELAFGLDNDKHRLVVTALIPLFEGVARRCWVDGFWKTAAREKFFADKVAASTDKSFDRIAWAATRTFVAKLYETNHDGDPKSLSLNRHWILHGRGPADASRVDALRLLQAVHTVVSLADDDQ
jgi:hypothetical protein